ncbi:MAG: endo-1,4-beta-xylanase [Halothermotrichaceae bacterium]
MNNYQHRKTTATIKVFAEDKTPLQNQELTVSQKDHEFLFGSNGFEIVPYANNELQESDKERTEKYIDKFLDLFNFVTLPFYWERFEPEKGKPKTRELMNTAKWCKDHNLVIKGHPLSWHTLAPDWLLDMSNEEIMKTQIKRIHRDVKDFEGLIDMWDVINEVVIMPIFDKYDNGLTRVCKELGRINTIKTVFEAARSTNPKATFILNDFDVSPAYDILIEGCLEAGIEIDIIGIQSHMHQGYWGMEKLQSVLERFSRFDIPIHFSETTIISGDLMPTKYDDLNDYQVDKWPSTTEGEERQARQVKEFYSTLFAHPMVTGITWWDFLDGQWLNAPSGLIREDCSAKPAYKELHKLVKEEWWTKSTSLTTDNTGQVEFTGFRGEYELSFGDKNVKFTLEDSKDKENTDISIYL